MKIATLYSGGKDSNYAVLWALEQGHDVVLVNMQPQEDSMMFHHPNIKWCEMQAKASQLPIKTFKTTHETELEDLKNALIDTDCEGLVTGAVASVYQKSRIDKIANDLGIEAFSPIWHKDSHFLKHMLEIMEVYFVAVSAQGLEKEWLAKRYLPQHVDDLLKLNPPINVFLEGGEGETFVTNASFFKKRIEIDKWNIQWENICGKAIIEQAHLVDK